MLDQFIEEKILKEMKSNFIYLPFIFQAIYSPLIEINNFIGKVQLKNFPNEDKYVWHFQLYFILYKII